MAPHPWIGSVVVAASSSLALGQVVVEASESASHRGNVLLIVADDLGVDGVSCYGEQPQAPPTPAIDSLAADGVLFRNAYTDPTCSPSRAAMLTGRYGFRTLLGEPIEDDPQEFSLLQSEITLAEGLHGAGSNVSVSAIGKWHLGSDANGGPLHPNLQGFDWFEGLLGNMHLPAENYFNHVKTTNGVQSPSTVYATTEQVDDAIARIRTMPEPWFLYLAFNAPHQPFHAPPQNLHGYTLVGSPWNSAPEHYRATIQAMDTEIGRLLASLSPSMRKRTTIVFTADNGTPNDAALAPFESGKCKGTLYEGGVNVPLIVSGRAVRQRGRECGSIVNSVDLFPTMLELLGQNVQTVITDGRSIDGVSLFSYLRNPAQAPLRSWAYAARFTPNGPGPYASVANMLRDERWKLITRTGQSDLFFDMQGMQLEGDNLFQLGPLTPEQSQAYWRLQDDLVSLLGS